MMGFLIVYFSVISIHETEIKMAEMVEMVEIILTWTLPKVEWPKLRHTI
jgi:hypothetical protein